MSSEIVTLESINFTQINRGLDVNEDGKISNPLGIDVDSSIILKSFESHILIKGTVYKLIKWEIQYLGESLFDIIEYNDLTGMDVLLSDLSADEVETWLMKKQLPVL